MPFPTEFSSMEPLFPQRNLFELKELAAELIKKASSLNSLLHPKTADAVKDLLRAMNSYYSNLIEGQSTNPVSIDAALRAQYESDPQKRNLQLLAVAHIDTQKSAEEILLKGGGPQITHIDFLKFLHKEFYTRLPDIFWEIEDKERGIKYKLVPGEMRTQEVTVGKHFPPLSSELNSFMARFHQVYSASSLDPLDRIIAGAAAHHRLAWIHPFLDGNGRVMRLFSDCFFMKEGLGGFGLWTISRGLARKKPAYYSALAMGDEVRHDDYDGRGALSDDALKKFCQFFLESALDQVNFMSSILNLEFFEKRLERFVGFMVDKVDLRPESFFLLRELFLRGQVSRGDVPRIMNLHERVARNVVADLTKYQLVRSDTPKADLQLNFHPAFAYSMFPSLYPENLDLMDFIKTKHDEK